MGIHQSDKNIRGDEEFTYGELKYLVEGNECRYLDGRRTEGYIEKIFLQSGMFRWRITKFENKGEFWDMDFEDVDRFQFEKSSKIIDRDKENSFIRISEELNRDLEILANEEERKKTEVIIQEKTIEVLQWIKNKDIDTKELNIDLNSSSENTIIVKMLEEYMREIGCIHLEKKTAYDMVLNPNSGEWIKGMIIVMAQMGLANYFGKVVRGDETFLGMGEKELRRKYIINRIAFIRAIFKLSNIQEVILYRGMASEGKWVNKKRALMHMTFSKEVAESFSTSMVDKRFKTAYLVKMPVCIDEIFMTYIETKEMNEKYKEREAIIVGKNTYNI